MRSFLLALCVIAGLQTAAAVPLAPRPLGPSPYHARPPLVASAGGRFLTVWQEELDDAGARVLGVFSNAAGARISLPIRLPAEGYPVALIAKGESFALLHWGGITEVDREGHVTGIRELDLPDPQALAWNGSHYLLVWRDGYGTRAAVLDDGGRPRHAPLPIVVFAAAIASGNAFFLFTIEQETLILRRIDDDGAVTATIVLDPRAGSVVANALPGGGVEAVWVRAGSIVAARITPAGAVESRAIIAGDGIPVGILGHVVAYVEYVQHVPPVRRLLVRTDTGTRVAAGNAWSYTAAAGNEVLLVARHSDRTVETIAVDARGNVSPPELVSIGRARQLPPVLGGSIAVWTELSGDASRVRSATLSREPFAVRTVLEHAELVTSDLPWNGAEYLTIVAAGGKIRAQRLDAAGGAVGRAAVLDDAPVWGVHVATAWAGDRWIAAWPSGRNVRVATVLPNGIVASMVERPLAAMVPPRRSAVGRIALAFDGARGVIAWLEGWADPCPFECPAVFAGFAAEIDRDGTIGAPRLLVEEAATGVAVAANGGEFAVALDFMIQQRGEWLPQTGVTIVPSGITRTFPGGGVSNIVADGPGYVLATREYERVVLRRLARDGSESAPPRALRVARADALARPGLALPFISIQESTPDDPGVAVVIREEELEVLEPVRRRRVRPQ